MPEEWRITSVPIDGDDELYTDEQIAVINQLLTLAGSEELDIAEYPLGRVQAQNLIEELNDVILNKIHAAPAAEGGNLLGKLIKIGLVVAGAGLVLSAFGDDCDE